jgi:hypothetical protein
VPSASIRVIKASLSFVRISESTTEYRIAYSHSLCTVLTIQKLSGISQHFFMLHLLPARASGCGDDAPLSFGLRTMPHFHTLSCSPSGEYVVYTRFFTFKTSLNIMQCRKDELRTAIPSALWRLRLPPRCRPSPPQPKPHLQFPSRHQVNPRHQPRGHGKHG